MKVKFIFTWLLVLCAFAVLTACGKKGGPFPPEGEENVYPRKYPQPEEK